MATYKFGEPISEDDYLEVNGELYPMVPIGMRAMRRMLVMQRGLDVEKLESGDLSGEAGLQALDLALDIVINAVRPEARDRFKEQIEESVSPNMLMQIATAVMSSFSDVDPTPPESPSGGSSATGPASTDGAPVAALTPTS